MRVFIVGVCANYDISKGIKDILLIIVGILGDYWLLFVIIRD